MDFGLSFCISSSDLDLGESTADHCRIRHSNESRHNERAAEQESCLVTALPDTFEIHITDKCQNTNPMDTSLFGFRLAVRNEGDAIPSHKLCRH